ncbi:MAG: hypothetical protein JSS43_05390 [Proteobacteria bacterium]|nr:hypothetical protein [Pseudomonadota bacterium]
MAFSYSAIAFLPKQMLFPHKNNLIVDEYLGVPPFGRLSTELVARRVSGLILVRPYIVWPGILAIV